MVSLWKAEAEHLSIINITYVFFNLPEKFPHHKTLLCFDLGFVKYFQLLKNMFNVYRREGRPHKCKIWKCCAAAPPISLGEGGRGRPFAPSCAILPPQWLGDLREHKTSLYNKQSAIFIKWASQAHRTRDQAKNACWLFNSHFTLIILYFFCRCALIGFYCIFDWFFHRARSWTVLHLTLLCPIY